MNDKYVLLVEDNPDDVTLTEIAFRKVQIPNRLKVAKDGQEALDILFGAKKQVEGDLAEMPALVLLDLKLPYISGLEVLKEIKTDIRTRQIPVIVMTSSIEDSDKNESYRLGADDFISKPTGYSRLIETMRKIKAEWLGSND